MLHLSEALNLPVYDASDVRLGRLEDVLVDTGRGVVERVLIRGAKRSISHARWAQVETFSPENRRVILVEGAIIEAGPGGDGEVLFLKRDVLDRQIIDIRGRKVVKVNDILLEPEGDDLVLRRVEIGLAGAVRRLLTGILAPRIVRRIADGLPEQGINWDYVGLVEPGSARIRLKVHQHLARMHPADLADILEDLGRVERKEIVSSMDPETAAQALSEAEPSVQASLVEAIHIDRAADLLEEMQPDEAADILGDLPKKRSQELLEAMDVEEREDVKELLRFHDNSAGGLMTTEFFTAQAGWTVGRTLAELRDVDPDLVGELDEIPIVEEGMKLVGVAPLVRLIRAPADAPVISHMRREARAVSPTTPFKEIVERFEKYHLRALAVTDDFGELIGLINIEDVLSHMATEG
jgi:magnesium transporter